MKKIIMVLAAGVLIASCHKSQQNNVQPQQPATAQSQAHKSTNGVQGAISAYYDSVLFTINLKELHDHPAGSLLAHNKSINTIYEMETTGDVDVFVPVLDAIHGDGFNPLWQEVEITFNPGHAPRQFFSDDQVLDAAAAGEITLTYTDEVYRCSIIGKQ